MPYDAAAALCNKITHAKTRVGQDAPSQGNAHMVLSRTTRCSTALGVPQRACWRTEARVTDYDG